MSQDKSMSQNQNAADDQSIVNDENMGQDQSLPDDSSTVYNQDSRFDTPPGSSDFDFSATESTTKDGIVIDDGSCKENSSFDPRAMSQMEILMYVGSQFEDKST
jgi:hypothetical protein